MVLKAGRLFLFRLCIILPILKKQIMLEKLFGWGKKKGDTSPDPAIPFGRYSDNNKPVAKVSRWTDADNLFKEKKYPESLDAFFEYLRDDSLQNVVYERNGAEGRFEFYQGSKIVRGNFTNERVNAELTLAKMPQPSVPVMRRLLEMNFSLYYSRFALDNERLCMRFDSDMETANPSKLYYGLKELATKGDKQDDLLVQDFSILQTTDNEHVSEIPVPEKEVKYEWLQKWLKETFDAIAGMDADKLSGGIAYILLSLVCRIDYLIAPEGKLLSDLEKIAGIYFQKDNRPATEKNRDMAEEFRKLQARSKEEVFSYLIRSKYTFAIVSPQNYKTVADSIHSANQNTPWYRENNYPYVASQICEYGIAYCQYSFSVPRVITELFHLYMMINYPDYFKALGFKEAYYYPDKKQFNTSGIIDKIKTIQEKWRGKYPHIDFKIQNLRFDNLVNFDFTFTNELELLNMESK
jgi:hypothetical protein